MDERRTTVFLTGFMGCGKSTVGGCLSRLLSLPFTDTDARIERNTKKHFGDLRAGRGGGLPRLETQPFPNRRGEDRQVVSTGAAFPAPENRRLMKEAGTVVFLRVRPETVYARLRGIPKPLLQKEDPEAEIRDCFPKGIPGMRAADLILDADEKTPRELAEEIAVGAGRRKEGKRQ